MTTRSYRSLASDSSDDIAWLSITCGGLGGSTRAGDQHVETDLRSLAAAELDVLDGAVKRLFADQHLRDPGRPLDAEVLGGHRAPEVGLEEQDSRSDRRRRHREIPRNGALAVARRRRDDHDHAQVAVHVEVSDVRAKQSEDLGFRSAAARACRHPNRGIAVAPGFPEPPPATGPRTPPPDRSARELGGRDAEAGMPPPGPPAIRAPRPGRCCAGPSVTTAPSA